MVKKLIISVVCSTSPFKNSVSVRIVALCFVAVKVFPKKGNSVLTVLIFVIANSNK